MHAAAPAGDAVRVVAKVWAVSCERISTVNPLAIRLLNLLACYAPDNLPATVLDHLDDTDDLATGEALALLASYSLITLTTSTDDTQTPEPQDLISVHRLVQATILAQLSNDQRDLIRHQAATLLQAALPNDLMQMIAWPTYRQLLPHARTTLPLDSPALAQVRDYLEASGAPAAALDIQRQIHTHYLHTSGPEHLDTLIAWHDLAYYLGVVGEPAAACDQLAALLPIEERVLGADHPNTLTTRHNLANWTGKAEEISGRSG